MDVFQFLDPYMVLQNYYQTRKKYEMDFSYAIWGEELGLKSSSTLRLMVLGKKRLSMGVAEKFVQRHLKNTTEQNYFRLLVMYAHAGTTQEKNAAWGALSKILSERIEQKEAADYFTYVSDVLCPKIMTMLSFDDLAWTEKNLAQALGVDEAQLVEHLAKLEKSGMILKEVMASGEAAWKSAQRLTLVSDKLGDVALRAYHNACLDEAKDAQNITPEKRRYKSLLLPLSEEEFQSLTTELNSFTKQLITKYQSDKYVGRKLYKMNINYFPVSYDIENNEV